jgi:hypothetical protein
VSTVESPSGELPTPPAWRRHLWTLGTVLATRPAAIAAALTVGLVLGLVAARAVADDPLVEARRAVESTLLPLAADVDAIWTHSTDARPAVADAVVAFRRDADPDLVGANLEGWLAAYDTAQVRLAGLYLPPLARPVQRQVVAAVTLSRDAVEVLGRAAEVQAATGDDAAVEDLLVEVGRLRQRSEQVTQAARAATGDLAGQTVDVAPLGPVSGFDGARP